jgi:hypothetical protein
MQADLYAQEIVKRIINADTEYRIVHAVFNPVTVPLQAIKRPLREAIKTNCPVSFKAKMLREIEASVIAALKNYGIRVSKK